MGYDANSIRNLISETAVHRAVYRDPALFELELDRVFGRAWLYVAHESEIATAGAFLATRMGRQPVVVVRQKDGSIRVLFNRCAHRGATICSMASGHTKTFVCAYHGWVYGLDGALQNVPMPEGYGADLAIRRSALGMAVVPRVDTYRGFVFASLSAEGPPLSEFLGPLASSIDDLVDRAPDGEVEIAGGVARHVYDGNWKFVLENHNDTIHPRFVHASSTSAAREQSDETATNGAGEIAVRQMRQNGAPPDVWEGLGLWVAKHGHSYMGDYHDDDELIAGSGDPHHAAYADALVRRHGAQRARQILSVSRFNSIVYPNLSFMSQFGQLRVIHPLAADRTAVHTYVFRLKGAPEAMFRNAVAFANVVNGAASCVLTDDLEIYERTQFGLRTDGNEWIDYSRGLGRDIDEPERRLRAGGSGTSEINVRNQFGAWLDYMTAEA